ncbi:MAG: hypothetical protein OEV91_00815, partial [Desulfobulbaceae bacterium]|nr:hypothetical protein [Desulfobulbaceae bacterium]
GVAVEDIKRDHFGGLAKLMVARPGRQGRREREAIKGTDGVRIFSCEERSKLMVSQVGEQSVTSKIPGPSVITL